MAGTQGFIIGIWPKLPGIVGGKGVTYKGTDASQKEAVISSFEKTGDERWGAITCGQGAGTPCMAEGSQQKVGYRVELLPFRDGKITGRGGWVIRRSLGRS
jgi:hypothetical protein